MRSVKVKDYGASNKIYYWEGVFHGFGQDGHNNSVAFIETSSGYIEEVPPRRIQFLEPADTLEGYNQRVEIANFVDKDAIKNAIDENPDLVARVLKVTRDSPDGVISRGQIYRRRFSKDSYILITEIRFTKPCPYIAIGFKKVLGNGYGFDVTAEYLEATIRNNFDYVGDLSSIIS